MTLWGNLVLSVAPLDGRVIATDKETGKVVWDRISTTSPTSS